MAQDSPEVKRINRASAYLVKAARDAALKGKECPYCGRKEADKS